MLTTKVVRMMFRDPTEEEQAVLRDHLQELAWAYTRQTAGLGSTEPYEGVNIRAGVQSATDRAYVTDAALFYQGHRKEMNLQWLRVLKHLESQLAEAAKWVATCAAAEGANFREIGDAWSITRQGALKKWGRAYGLRAAPDIGDRVRLIYGDESTLEGIWEDTPDGPALRLDDGTLHEHVAGPIRREVIERAADA